MKKDKIKIGNIEVDYNTNGVLKLFEIYRKMECNPDRIKKLEHDISQFKSVDEKIKYCKNLQKEYLLYLDWETLAVSGMTIAKSIFPKDAKLFFDREIQNEIDSLEAEKLTSKIKKRVITAQPNSFDELVNDKYSIQPFIDILKEVELPLIDAECNYIGKYKGALVVWIDELTRHSIIKKTSDIVLSLLLPQKINRLTISESTFRKSRKNAEDYYRIEFKQRISEIKLSQNSHSGKLGK